MCVKGEMFSVLAFFYQVHVSKESSVPDHCRSYALSGPSDPDFQATCTHKHTDYCDRCNQVEEVFGNIDEALALVSEDNKDFKEQLVFKVAQAKRNINAWKAHLLRNINQDEARIITSDSLDEKSVLLVQDWAMKFLPRKYRESQTDWFGKRGLSWHITVAMYKSDNGEIHSMTFVHVFQSCKQDNCTTLSIMKDVVHKLKEELPKLEIVYYRQDNAGCYHCCSTIVGASTIGKDVGVSVRRMDFSDPQGGKGSCDRKAATVKSHMKIFLNTGNNIETGEEMVAAMQSSGGIPGVKVILASTAIAAKPLNVKMDGVSTFSNIEYGEGYLKVWKAYGIGPGKKLPLSKLGELDQESAIVDLSTACLKKDAAVQSDAHFIPLKKSVRSCKQSAPRKTTQEEAIEESYNLFSCPEEGCIKTYQRYSALQHHLDCGKHERKLEHETLCDRAAHGYANRLQGLTSGVPEMSSAAKKALEGSTTQRLPMGWALRSNQGRKKKRFSEKQKSFLTDRFLIGEATGRKEDAMSVAKAMMTVKDADGHCLFNSTEFLTSKQIAGFFSRLAAKRQLLREDDSDDDETDDDETDDDIDPAENEEALSQLKNRVLEDVSLTHPICFDRYNLCDLNKKSKLSNLSIPVLQDICKEFDIPASDITKKRKAPYIERIFGFIDENCTCIG